MIKQIPDEVQPILLFLLRELGKEADAPLEIDRPSVIGINQSEVPKLRALVKVRDSRAGDLQQKLSKRIQRTV